MRNTKVKLRLLAGLCLVLVAAACSGGPSVGGTGASTSGLPKGTPLQVLGASADATVGTVHMDCREGAAFSGIPGQADLNLTLAGTGTYDLTHRAAELTLNGNGGRVLKMIVIGNTAYFNTVGLGLSGAKPWVTYPASTTGTAFNYAQFAQTAFIGAKLLSKLQHVTVVGSATVRGTPTTHFHGSLGVDDALTALGSSGGLGQVGEQDGSIAVQDVIDATKVPVSAWIDGHDRLRRLTMSIDLAPIARAWEEYLGPLSPSSTPTTPPKATVDFDCTLYDFGPAVAISPPPADQVGPPPPRAAIPGTGVRVLAHSVHQFWPIPYTDSGGFRTPLRRPARVRV